MSGVRRCWVGSALDAGALARLHASAISDAWPEAAFASLLARPQVFVLLGSTSVEPVVDGFVLVRIAADEAEVLTFCVANGARRRGLGATLLDAACNIARDRGGVQMFLEVSEGNPGAFALYQKRGFSVVGRRAAYYRDGLLAADAVVMRKVLSMAANAGLAPTFQSAPESTKSK